jgi:peptidoglycan/LPS O-acetylase OafA/YrhL
MVRIAALDGLRGLAVILVFCVHFFAGYELKGYGPQSLRWLFESLHSGHVGVDIFFAISGYLIALTAPVSDRAFLLKRYSRLVPAYLAAMALSAIAGSLWSHQICAAVLLCAVVLARRPNVLELMPITTAAVLCMAAFTSEWTPVSTSLANAVFVHDFVGAPTILFGSWALCAEFLFYYAFLAVRRISGIHTGLVLLAVSMMAFLIGCFLGGPKDVVCNMLIRSPAFAFGVLVYDLQRQGVLWSRISRASRDLYYLPLAALALLLFSFRAWILPIEAYTIHFASASIVAALLLVSVLCSAKLMALFTFSPLRNLGAGSYSIYLIHSLVIGFVDSFGLTILPAFVFSAILTLCTGAILYRLLEAPYFAYKKKA